jgi:hypothetical protein
MWAHQYVQLSNQIACKTFPSKPIFGTNGKDAHLFGLEPHFGCCTANFGQAWPKLALSAFLHRGNTVISAVPLPSVLETDGVSVELKTNYPFENKLSYRIAAKETTSLRVRIPSFAKELTVNGVRTCFTSELSFEVKGGETRHIEIEFGAAPTLIPRPHNLHAVRCGSLVFSLPIAYEKKMLEYEKNGVARKFPYCDYEYLPLSEWSFGYSSPFFTREEREVSEIPFDSKRPPVVLKAKVKKIAWGLEEGYDSVCAKIPESRTPLSEETEIELHPYGCAKLRMTELPLI